MLRIWLWACVGVTLLCVCDICGIIGVRGSDCGVISWDVFVKGCIRLGDRGSEYGVIF